LGVRLRRIDERCAIEAGDGRGEGRRSAVEVVADGRLAHQTGAMRHELTEGDRPSVGVVRMEVGQIPGYWRVEVDLASLDELHNRYVREELGDRADAIDGLRPCQPVGRGVNDPEAARPDNLLIIDESDGKDAKTLYAHLAVDQPLELVGNGGIVAPRRW